MIGKIALLTFGGCLALAFVVVAAPGAAAEPTGKADKAEKKPSSLKNLGSQKPLPDGTAKFSHAPYSHGDCSICHVSKDPQKPGKLSKPARVQCLNCHEYQRGKLKASSTVHTPVKKECTYCHNAHNSNNRRLLLRPPGTICASCHTDKQGSEKVGVVHDAVVKQRACKNCHVHHSSNTPNLLRGSEFNLCISCHDKPDVKDEQGKVLADIRELYREMPVHHGPFAKKSCASCHDPHFSKYHRLLKSDYPATFYSDFSEDSYQLCFDCHDPLRITVHKTRDLTGFRDGVDNLHYVHVVKADPGRSCRACHEDHGTDHAHLVRTSVPYGSAGWMLPLNYVATATGGSCEKTCHNKETYDNNGVRPDDIAAEYKKKFGSSFPVPPAAQAGKKAGKGAKKAGADDETFSMEVYGPDGQDVDPAIKAEAHYNYAKRLYKQNRLDDALTEVLQALELEDQLAETHALAGVIYAKQKRCDLAAHEFDKALALDPKNGNAKKGQKLLGTLTKSGKCVTQPEPPGGEPQADK